MITGRDLGSYAIRFKARPWHETDFYTYCVFCILHTTHRDLTKAKNMTDMGYVDNSDRMVNSYSMCRRTFKWTTKLFVHLLDLTVLNSWILLSSCGAKYTHRNFRLLLVRDLIEEAGKSQDRSTPRLVGRPSAAANKCFPTRESP